MAEGNKPSVPKKKHPTDRGPQFSFNIEVPRTQESRLLGIKDRIKMAKGSLNLTKATTSTQNADLMEALLLAFEEKIERKWLTSSDLSLSSTGIPNYTIHNCMVFNSFSFFHSIFAYFFAFCWSFFSNFSSTSRTYATKNANHCIFSRERLHISLQSRISANSVFFFL